MNSKTTVFLAGDSTVQSYSINDAPQSGWGQQLIRYYGESYICSKPCPDFPNVYRYESENICIENRAMMARSTRTFLLEKRMENILNCIIEGDWLLIQFGHNDANREKPERFADSELFKKNLIEGFIEPARSKGVNCVLVTPIAMRLFDDQGKCKISFPEYRQAMIDIGKKADVPVIDLGLLTAQFNTDIGSEACKTIYMHVPEKVFDRWKDGNKDDAHLQFNGAYAYAGIVAREINKLMDEKK